MTSLILHIHSPILLASDDIRLVISPTVVSFFAELESFNVYN